MARLGDICTLVNGYAFKPTDWKTEGLPIIRIQNLNDSNAMFNYYNGVIDEKYLVHDGDLLFSWSGTPGTSFGAFFWNRGNGILNQHIFNVHPIAGIDKAYLRYALNGNINRIIDKAHGGVGLQHITKKELVEIDIPILSYREQQEIVTVLDRVDCLISLRKEQLAKLDQLVKARFVEIFGDSRHNSKSFPVKKLGDICKVGSSKRIYQNELSSNGVPFLRVSDLNKQIEEGVCTPELFISEAKYDDFMLRGLVPKAGDILVTSRGTLGKCYIVNNDDRFYFQDGMISWLSDLDSNVSSLYISYLFSTTGIQEQIMNLQAGSTVAYLSVAMLKRLDIMLPTILEQEQFASFVEQTNKTKLTIQASLDKLEVMKKALMQEYFG